MSSPDGVEEWNGTESEELKCERVRMRLVQLWPHQVCDVLKISGGRGVGGGGRGR